MLEVQKNSKKISKEFCKYFLKRKFELLAQLKNICDLKSSSQIKSICQVVFCILKIRTLRIELLIKKGGVIKVG